LTPLSLDSREISSMRMADIILETAMGMRVTTIPAAPSVRRMVELLDLAIRGGRR
jgi:hypothetical protein